MSTEYQEIFSRAYRAYRDLCDLIDQTCACEDLFEEHNDSHELSIELDMCLQFLLIRIAAASGVITQEEHRFITELPDHLEEICTRYEGYRRFLNTMSADTWESKGSEFFPDIDNPKFLRVLRESNREGASDAINLIKSILDCMIKVSDVVNDKEKRIARLSINQLQADSMVIPDEVRWVGRDLGESESYTHDLNSLIGLKTVKKDVSDLINLLRINEIRKKHALPVLRISMHMVFTGNPGTGKTTVARILAGLYKELGVLSKGHLVETDRSGLVAGYVGQTAIKTAQVIKRAIGGVLFIDEAYSLTDAESQNDYGAEAVDTLVKAMEDQRHDLVVIVAGYPDKMEHFIASNPGLRSRFNKFIHFDDYSAEELKEIFTRFCEEKELKMTKEAEQSIMALFHREREKPEFGNARGARNLFERTITAQATRILMTGEPSREFLCTITEEDVPSY